LKSLASKQTAVTIRFLACSSDPATATKNERYTPGMIRTLESVAVFKNASYLWEDA
jgi:hypothetical protein